ncbi:transcription factor bhlh47 [Phtheirospermum japonicum]|uniref:Transcription factor bhlh47 n=1 Tax=Phtheirospermum japonicum TaxID=374723 RepID=A0A830CPN3_9LAMI|nr:transcription factor bhlh47 [Phtheirospermum japonicum]
MGSEIADPVCDRVKASPSSKKNPEKVPRKIHKAAREKLKRDHMNDLFFDLGKTLDLDHTNNGKASILRETIRLVGELLTQVESLKKENVALLSESNYVTSEKNELLDETSALDAQVKRLRKEIDERVNLDISRSPSDFTAKLTEDHVAAFPLVGHAQESTPVVGPVFVVPLPHESQGFCGPFPKVNMPKVSSSVSKPRPRYPSSSDSWPSQILTRETNVVEDV